MENILQLCKYIAEFPIFKKKFIVSLKLNHQILILISIIISSLMYMHVN